MFTQQSAASQSTKSILERDSQRLFVSDLYVVCLGFHLQCLIVDFNSSLFYAVIKGSLAFFVCADPHNP